MSFMNASVTLIKQNLFQSRERLILDNSIFFFIEKCLLSIFKVYMSMI